MAQGNSYGQNASNNGTADESPNMLVYRKMEDVIARMQEEKNGIPIRTVKSFLSKIPSVFSGTDIVQWLLKNLNIEDQVEALHLGTLMAAHGYFFPISDHVLTLKDDGTFYRFQTPYFWPSNCWEPENTDYAVYLCKRTMQNKARLELADYEAESLARLQRAFARKWEFIFMQAEAQAKVDKKRDKIERKILDSQERAFWDVHRPVPGCVNTTEVDIKKSSRMRNPHKTRKPWIHSVHCLQLGGSTVRLMTSLVISNRVSLLRQAVFFVQSLSCLTADPPIPQQDLQSVYGLQNDVRSHSPTHTPAPEVKQPTVEELHQQIKLWQMQLDRHRLKMSKVAESLIGYSEQYMEFDPFLITPEPSNPWMSDDISFWELEASKEPYAQRVKRWGFCIDEVLKDPVGREQFLKFVESEFSSENLRFWLAVLDLKKRPIREVPSRVQEIWQEFLAPGAPSAINVDSKSYDKTTQNVKDPGRYAFEDAQEHIYKLMKSDSYPRFIRSSAYQELLQAKKKEKYELILKDVHKGEVTYFEEADESGAVLLIYSLTLQLRSGPVQLFKAINHNLS
ncbi:regulator of G-protein signaling 7 isoform X2 [Scyliorhinus canicula]|uniref:regulator of G-protein signaling 7 isoform X2 n=1 Tax=Scyliorhinus canicula TaxID=7830 RepID=UPI0018F68C3E|nr:regulator of G-protein signaling 7 isoform X2 [Scyliorhinus canicula]